MFFRIDKKIMKCGTGVYTGVVTAYGVDNRNACSEVTELLTGMISEARDKFAIADNEVMSFLQPYRDAMKSFGINPSKYACSIESILRRIQKTGSFPSVSPVVDLANYISIKYGVPIGVHDIDTMTEDLWVRLATLDDCNNPENNIDSDVLHEGEPIYATGTSVRTRRWFWRQMPAGRVTENSNNFIFPIDGFESNKETIDAACNELVRLLADLFGVKAESGTISGDENEIRFGKMTEEDEMVENQIAIMLKGVAQHTSIPDIRAKVLACLREKRPLRIKLGLDPSAPDIHIGHAVVLRKIRQLQDLGHIAVIIIGDYTGMIGDPSGKSKTRKQLSRDEVEKNAETYMEQIFKIIDRDKTEVHFNSEWLSKMNFGDVIELASKCTVARMLERDDFSNRYTNHLPLSVHEFFYPLMQAYDSVAIRADIELGGTDQTFNILMGRNIQRDYGQEPQITLFMPLLEGIDGVEKMSKSLGNYVGISEDPSIIYEKLMKIPDDKIIKYFNLCTDRHPQEIRELEEALLNGVNPRDIKMKLAYEITALYSGQNNAQLAEEHFVTVFQRNQIPEDAPIVSVDPDSDMPAGEQITSYLVQSGYFKSKAEIRRIFSQGGAQLNGERVLDLKEITSFKTGDALKIGKNKYFQIVVG